MWGTTGIGYNEDKIKKILGDAPLDSWNYIFDPKLAAKFKDCGISVLDAPDEILKIVLAWMGHDPNSQKEEDLKAAEAKLMPIRPFIRKIHSSQYIDDLANGELCIAVGWSGDILQARDRADGSRAGREDHVRDSEGRHDHLVRHAGDPGRRQASEERARLHQLPDGAAGRGQQFQLRELRQRQRGVARDRERRSEERSGHLSDAGSEGEAVPARWPTARTSRA